MSSGAYRALRQSFFDAILKCVRPAPAGDGAKRFVRKAAVEALEQRCLLSFTISANALDGPINTAGSSWTYHEDMVGGGTRDEVVTVGNPAMFQGHAAIQGTDNTTTVTPSGAPGDPPVTTEANVTVYGAILAVGPVIYGGTETGVLSGTIVWSPYEQYLPAMVTVGVPYTFNYTETGENGSATVIADISHTATLMSGTTTTVVVPAGTFQCYEVDETITRTAHGGTASSTETKQKFCAVGTGVVEMISDGGAPQRLTNFVKHVDTLKFQQGPSETEVGNIIKPPIIVEIDKLGGGIDSTGGDSTDFVTLSITGGGTLTGTATVAAVAGVATFSNISIPTAGTYTLTATSDPMSPVTSSSVTIDEGSPSALDPTLPRLKVPTTAVGGSNVNINASITVTNSTDATVSGPAKVSAFLVGPNVAAALAHSGSFIATPADTVMLQVGKTVTQKVNLKPHKAGHLTMHLTSIPNVPVAGSYALEFVVTDPKGNTATVIGPSITVGPAVITLSETIAAMKIPSTVTIGQKLKAGSIKLIVKNSGNVIAKGKTTFAVSVSTTSGIVGTPITSLSTVLNTAPNKTKPVTINIKSLPTLAAGSYFIVIQATDSMGNKSIVSSTSPITVSA